MEPDEPRKKMSRKYRLVHKYSERNSIAGQYWMPAKVKKLVEQHGLKSIPEIAKELSVTVNCVEKWLTQRPDFIEAYKEGVYLFWERIAGIMHDCYSKGYSDHEVSKEIGISRKTYWDWHKTRVNETFVEAYESGRTLTRAWWDQQGRENIANRKINAPVYIWLMKIHFNLFDPLVISEYEKNTNNETESETEVQSTEIRLKRIITREIKGGKSGPELLEEFGEEEDPGGPDPSR